MPNHGILQNWLAYGFISFEEEILGITQTVNAE